VYATLTYEDQRGRETYAITKNQVVIGRGGVGYWVDLKLQTAPDVSREHARLRRDEATGQFFLKDVSTLGTTVDGQPVPTSVEVAEGTRRDKNVEVPLPARARIGLAETVFLDFEARRSS
jgi:pSer/pThr/pTyr-binding forkhead associated (FHA) protein